ncbi:MAG TPA: tRNA (adenosine(37)-N6)-threonylcarbamoyltransferase complex ATPase subunit type 1 TsaE [Candidatus Omnitrophota bacterium]|nr:tRNA (adenosine(37)-N6)-threonylcarbamoyltransferase complex ATPase subunit type 1 TsaE [Candidatus Omnitrophota bacterium]HPN88820.1 tRNA (adenosine(37)-N6)-threonylcarbamoyltransferase complex ATPase subunit type 1 TsaE [Candidatus Omnitrophota bacterium]
MEQTNFISENEEETIKLGKSFAKILNKGDILCLEGNLGSGKTTFVRGVAQGLGISQKVVHSPTFTLMNVYENKKISLFHFDLYRVEKIEQIFSLDYQDFFYGKGISVIEWAEKLGPLMPKKYWEIRFRHIQEYQRQITIKKY